MRTAPPPLVPLFRSDAQARLLEQLALYREEPITIPELAGSIDVPYQTVYKEVQRLGNAGLLRIDKVGNAALVSLNHDSPAAGPLRDLLEAVLGLRRHLAHELCNLPAVDQVWIYGSWAARYHGTSAGPPPQDVDVLVVASGALSSKRVRQACSTVARRVNREINPVTIRRAEWERADSGFLRDVKNGPLVYICNRGPS